MDGVVAAALPHLHHAAAHRGSLDCACERRGGAGAPRRSEVIDVDKARGSIAGAIAVPAPSHDGAAGGADVSLPLNHAGGDAVNVRDTLAAEALRVPLAGRPLLGGALGGGGYGDQRGDPYGDGRKSRWDQLSHAIVLKPDG